MPYKARNTLYLRISKKIVLPIYVCRLHLPPFVPFQQHLQLYLDEKHLDWMSDEILQHVLEDIRPNILSKLRAESEFQTGGGTTVKKGSLETHRGCETSAFANNIFKTHSLYSNISVLLLPP